MDRITQVKYEEAVHLNDLAHQKTLIEADRNGILDAEKIREIGEESIMWLRHLDFLYHIR